MSEIKFNQFSDLLRPEGPVAIVIKQSLAAVNEDDPVIFPPSYPMTTFKGRIWTMRDGDYRVSVELPPDSKRDKNDRSSDQKSGYNIDRFPDGTNCCEIDSPQSQANRIEPMFKKPEYRNLVPQIEIRVGDNALHGTTVNLLDAGHRAADAVVRMSSLADSFHTAFLNVKEGNDFTLATLAPTSLLFGVWDSRSTNVKRQRIVKAHIRVSNVQERTRSAQFTPAADYVAAGAVEEGLDSGEGDKNPLSVEGMKHALATQTVGGVMLTKTSELIRTVNINLVALRDLRGSDDPHTQVLQSYVLGLSLIAATLDPDLNLREGCNLRFKDAADSTKLVSRRGDAKPVTFDPQEVEQFARLAAEEFFRVANIAFDGKDHVDAIFETGVAEEFLGMGDDREKVRKLGPITRATLKRFKELGKDPFRSVVEQLKAAKKALGKPPKRNQPAVKNLDAFKPLCETLKLMSENAGLANEARDLAGELSKMAQEHDNSHAVIRDIEAKFREFKKAQKKAEEEHAANSEVVPAGGETLP